jgi:hypothetical protein
MDTERYLVVFYALFWIVRIYGCFRRGRQPLLRGPEWFFNVPVPADFHKNAGRALLHRYWMRIVMPLAVDIPIAAAMFYTNHIPWLRYLILGECVLIHLNHLQAVDAAERRARALLDTPQEPVARVSVSLQPRRLRDYSNAKIEWALGLTTLFVFVWLTRYATTDGHHDLRYVFAVPLLMLYLQIGLLFVKQIAVAWRMPVPQSQIDEHTEVREQTRRHYLQLCDWLRATIAIGMLLWPVKLTLPAAMHGRLITIWLTSWMVIAMGAQVWLEIRRKRLVTIALRARPVRMPEFLEPVRGPLCYEPSAPMLLLKGANGYSLNLANTRTQLAAVYLAGLVVLFAMLPT